MVMYCKQKGTDYNCPSSLICCCILPIKHCSVEQLFECGEQRGCLLKVTHSSQINSPHLGRYEKANSTKNAIWYSAVKLQRRNSITVH